MTSITNRGKNLNKNQSWLKKKWSLFSQRGESQLSEICVEVVKAFGGAFKIKEKPWQYVRNWFLHLAQPYMVNFWYGKKKHLR